MKKAVHLFLIFTMVFSMFFGLETSKMASAATTTASASTFSWDNATVYFALTDRFLDGDSSNNHSYGRELDQNGNEYSGYKSKTGTFHGGDLKGLTTKINEGYFNDLGVNAIWITAPYEQIHGWVGGESFRHYAYHGYYTLDYTEIDKNMGTEADFKTFVDTAHTHGIRVVMDVVMNHAGYETLKDMSEFNFGQLANGWQNYYYNQPESAAHYNTYGNYVVDTDSSSWARWWGSDWVRVNKSGYTPCGSSDTEMCLSGLPDFKTGSSSTVGLPPILQTKWDNAKEAKEVAELNAYFSNTGKPRTPSNYINKWLTDWVREYGIDGFRVDTAKHVEQSVWKDLKTESVKALKEWKAANPTKKMDDLDFWMTGEVWGHGVGKSSYFSNGFDSLINFSFQSSTGNLNGLESIYSSYAASINTDPSFNMLSYMSSHDTSLYNRSNLINGGTSLLLLPGAVQIYYGDETGRQPSNSPGDQATRSDMNWSSINTSVLSHWQKLGQFRSNHIAVGAGSHKQLQTSPYAFSRTYSANGIDDKVAVAVGASGSTSINVSSVFVDGTTVRDFYTGYTAVVSGGKATFTAGTNGVILIEEVPTLNAKVSASPAGGSFSTDTKEITLYVRNAETGKYTLDGTDPQTNGISFTNGQSLTIGSGMGIGDSKALRLYAGNNLGSVSQQYVFTKTDRSLLTVHFKKPSTWGTPQLYYYETTPVVTGPTWASAPAMVSEGDGWYKYTIEDVESAHVIFKDASNQIPAAQQAGLVISAEGWYDNGWVAKDTTKPTAPTNLTASAKTENSVTLTWSVSTDNVGVTGYEIYRDDVKVGTSASATYKDVGLTAETAYTYTVKAYDAAGNKSDASSALQATTEPKDTVAPAAPTNLQSSSKTNNSVTLSWSASTDNVGVTGYEIYRNNVKVNTSATTIYTDSGLAAATEYTYTVKAYDAAGNISAASDELKVTTSAQPLTNTATIYYKRGYSTPYFHYAPTGGTWTTAPGKAMTASTEYPGYSAITVDIGTAASLSAVFNNGSGTWDNNGGKNYTFQQGTWTFESGTIKAGTPAGDTTAPSVPNNVQSTAKTNNSVTLSWSASTDNVGVTGYEIYRNNVKVNTSATTTYTDSGLAAATEYTYAVKAYDAAGNISAASDELKVTTSAQPQTNTATIY
ncbi:alpha-amylase family glycosyl hydrolase [Cohnella cholangitidis]|uniref:Starch-binding protein n=1 Tax=Cohnella cholangitidis TaxID=2598458 RepID=A0A7G5C013_9BACL|nr:alpha-amylase family glycosyl hydrolase [Cohnella cholangitidis]QMV42547.1 starch-binding protein [Cohnella cholangitidis]